MAQLSIEQKAQEFAEDRGHDNQSITEAFVAALDMAEWQKQQILERAADFISKRFYIGINNQATSRGNYYSLTELIRDLEKSMEGE